MGETKQMNTYLRIDIEIRGKPSWAASAFATSRGEIFQMDVKINDLVTYESVDHIATITINRADRMNALNEDVILGLQQAWQHLEQSDDRVAVLHAAGDRAFSVGADVKDPPKEMWQGVPSIGATTSKPVVAAVHGWCIGGAYVIVQMCDMVVAADNTTFKYPEAQLGFTGGLISSAMRPHPAQNCDGIYAPWRGL